MFFPALSENLKQFFLVLLLAGVKAHQGHNTKPTFKSKLANPLPVFSKPVVPTSPLPQAKLW